MLLRRRRAIGIALAAVTMAVVGHDLLAALGKPPVPGAAGHAAGGVPAVAAPPATAQAEPAPRVPSTGPGTFRTAAGSSTDSSAGSSTRVGSGALTRYTVEVEDGLSFSPRSVAAVVDATLADPRSWAGSGRYAFRRVPAKADLRVLLATPGTTDRLCAPLQTQGLASCRNQRLVVLNARLWAAGTPAYAGRLADYRRYMVNHELGHALGHRHTACPGRGRPAPVMMQQTYGLQGCRANPWPRP